MVRPDTNPVLSNGHPDAGGSGGSAPRQVRFVIKCDAGLDLGALAYAISEAGSDNWSERPHKVIRFGCLTFFVRRLRYGFSISQIASPPSRGATAPEAATTHPETSGHAEGAK